MEEFPSHMTSVSSLATQPNATSYDGHGGYVPTAAPLDPLIDADIRLGRQREHET